MVKDSLFLIMFIGIMSLFNIFLTIPILKEIWLNNDYLIVFKILIEIFTGLFLFAISFIITSILTFGAFGE